MIRAVFFDLDGTLFSHRTQRIPDSTMESLRRLREKGILTVLCTGRSLDELRELDMLGLPLDGYVLLNGQLVLNEELELIAGFPFRGEAKQAIVTMFEEKRIPVILMEQERIYISFVNDTVRAAQAAVHTSVPEILPYDGEEFYMAVTYFSPSDHEREIRGCVLTEWYDGATDVIPEGSGKEAGMQAFMDAFGITVEEIMAFGDGENDAGMLAFAGVGVAMDNACENTKKTADYVTADIDDDGILKALLHFGLISSAS